MILCEVNQENIEAAQGLIMIAIFIVLFLIVAEGAGPPNDKSDKQP